MTLNQTWKNCLEMWRWVVKEWKKDRNRNVTSLKREWIEKYRPDIGLDLFSDCFFCQYDEQRDGAPCSNCPGCLVQGDFSCYALAYDYEHKPDKFLAKIERLNKKRLGKK